ncbi:MAG TPA: hypothetical protein VMN57_04390 [Anaerolineales bacterium]|nr:hypothetical protein [Anaerolineales bacterium]
MKRNLLVLAFVWAMLVFALSGCFGAGVEEVDPNVTPSQVSEGPRMDTEGQEVPEDIPIMPGAYRLDVISSGSQINFTIDGDIQSVMDYYAAELAENGWEPTRAPDSVIGVVGSMSRQNAVGDVVSVTLQYNSNGNFVTVTIAVSRK